MTRSKSQFNRHRFSPIKAGNPLYSADVFDLPVDISADSVSP